MGTKLEVKGTLTRVVDSPPTGEDGLTKLVVGCEGKGIGIDFEGVGRGRELHYDLGGRLADELELGVAGKAMLWQLIRLSINMIGIIKNLADYGEKDGGMTAPKLGVGLPQKLLATDKERGEFGPERGDLERDVGR